MKLLLQTVPFICRDCVAAKSYIISPKAGDEIAMNTAAPSSFSGSRNRYIFSKCSHVSQTLNLACTVSG